MVSACSRRRFMVVARAHPDTPPTHNRQKSSETGSVRSAELRLCGFSARVGSRGAGAPRSGSGVQIAPTGANRPESTCLRATSCFNLRRDADMVELADTLL